MPQGNQGNHDRERAERIAERFRKHLEKCRIEKLELRKEIRELKKELKEAGEELVKASRELGQLREVAGKLAHLGLPPYFPAVYIGISTVQDPLKDVSSKVRIFDAGFERCLILSGGSEYVGSVKKEIADRLTAGQLVYLNSNRAIVGPVPESDIEQLVAVQEGRVSEVRDNLVLITSASGYSIQGSVVSPSLKMELEAEPLKPGDRVLLFESVILKVLERARLDTSVLDVKEVAWDDLVGLDEQKKEVLEKLNVGIDEDLIERFDLKKARGALFFGPPGNGKTSFAVALAKKLDWYIEILNAGEIPSKWWGEAGERLRASFRKAKENAPAIWFIDEADAAFPARGDDHSRQLKIDVLTSFTALMQGAGENEGVFTILATNRKDLIDRAAVRVGRLDIHIEFPRPTEAAAREILKVYLSKKPIAGDEEATMQEIIGTLVGDIYGKSRAKRLFRAFYPGGHSRYFYLQDFVASSELQFMITEAAIRAAKRIQADRNSEFGITPQDVENVARKVLISNMTTDTGDLNKVLQVQGYDPADSFRDFAPWIKGNHENK